MSQTRFAPSGTRTRTDVRLATAAIAAQIVFTLAWVVLGLIEGHGYSFIGHTESDLYARTSSHLLLMELANALTGVTTITFALVVLRRAFSVPGRRAALGPWLVAGSLVSLDCLAGLWFKLDCRVADGCTVAMQTASFAGRMHYIEGIPSAIMHATAAFALARRMRLLPAWRDLARPAVIFGIVNIITMAGFGAFEFTFVGGIFAKLPQLFGSIGVIVLAWRVVRLESATDVEVGANGAISR